MYRTVFTPLVYSWARLHGIRARRTFRRATANCAAAQRAALLAKLRNSSGTEYGRRFLFSKIASPDEYRRVVPIVTYEDLAPSIDRIVRGERNVLFPHREKLLMFAMTSGSTGRPKYVPVTGRYYRELAKGNFVWAVHLLHDHPSAIAHKILHVVSPRRERETELGVPCGAATGLVAESQKKIARIKYALMPDVYRIDDYDAKYYCIMWLAMQHKISLLIAANPSTLVALGRCLEKNAGRMVKDWFDGTLSVAERLDPEIKRAIAGRVGKKRALASRLDRLLTKHGRLLPRDVWPELALIGCWTGGTLTPYLDLVREYWGDKPLRDPGLIASEGRMTIPLEDGGRGGVLDVESHFYEFMPYNGGEGANETLLAHELQEGEKYYIILTTSSGFYRYNISDVVEATGRFGDAPVLKFLHKGNRISSLTGEKISEHQVVEAFRACERRLGFTSPQFAVCPAWAVPPFYFVLLEERPDGTFTGKDGERLVKSMGEQFDVELSALNVEYKNKRDSGRLGAPVVRLIPAGSFERDKQDRIRKSGGRLEQYKHAYLSPDLDYCARFGVETAKR
jgi:acyl-CoA synthetase (AMP-forming)/AMP-acid ligase II